MGVENGMFRSEIGSGFEDPGGTPPPRIPRSTPPGPVIAYFAKIIEREQDGTITNRHNLIRQVFISK